MGKMKDLTGMQFGKLKVLNNAGKLDGRHYYWNCQCDCGNTKVVLGSSLTSGNTKSCGCLAKETGIQRLNKENSEKAKIPIGAIFGKLVVIEDIGFREQVPGHNRRWYKCRCECGQIKEVMGNFLKQGQISSCGKCMSSKGELKIQKIFDENNIKYQHDKSLDELYRYCGRRLRFDFILRDENNNIIRIIEFDGRQHLVGPDTNYWGHTSDTLETIQEKDQIKNDFCSIYNIPLVRIPYTHVNLITLEDLLGDKFLVRGDK